MVTPLHLAITPMSVLQDPKFGMAYAKLFEDGDVDDRLLMILFLMVERIRGSSSLWAPYPCLSCPNLYLYLLVFFLSHSYLGFMKQSLATNVSYLDVLPTSFGTPLWFTEEELQELKGTTLYKATRIQVH